MEKRLSLRFEIIAAALPLAQVTCSRQMTLTWGAPSVAVQQRRRCHNPRRPPHSIFTKADPAGLRHRLLATGKRFRDLAGGFDEQLRHGVERSILQGHDSDR